MRILSLGAGVQSTTILLMACAGEEHVEAAIFADTGWEPHWVYEHLDNIERIAQAAGIPVFRVSDGNLRADALENKTQSWMPVYSVDSKGRLEQLKRQCTRNYKIRPIRRKARALSGGKPIQQLVGISWDEWERMRDSDVKYITNVYPLIDKRMTRTDCVAWLTAHGYPIPRKSSCIACPLRSAREWREIRADDASWTDAVDFDERIRRVRDRTRHQEVFVHREGVPLVTVDLRSEQERGQLEFDFDGCGVLCAA
jgi:3'-phosphoadenosine 5'-phosphosulfate sulfotransferase (PAPS reductase)/FAD synthetase